MHELSVALDIIDIASEAAATLGDVQVSAVRLRIGALSGVARDALLFSFDVASAGTPLDGARLTFEEVPVKVWCATCVAECELVDPAIRRCARCQSPAPRLVRGDELEVIGLEVQER
jgi:hydrogenase nickel incorporation protein HypA/HybF